MVRRLETTAWTYSHFDPLTWNFSQTDWCTVWVSERVIAWLHQLLTKRLTSHPALNCGAGCIAHCQQVRVQLSAVWAKCFAQQKSNFFSVQRLRPYVAVTKAEGFAGWSHQIGSARIMRVQPTALSMSSWWLVQRLWRLWVKPIVGVDIQPPHVMHQMPLWVTESAVLSCHLAWPDLLSQAWILSAVLHWRKEVLQLEPLIVKHANTFWPTLDDALANDCYSLDDLEAAIPVWFWLGNYSKNCSQHGTS